MSYPRLVWLSDLTDVTAQVLIIDAALRVC